MKRIIKELLLVTVILTIVTSCGNKVENKESNLNIESENEIDKEKIDELETFMDSEITINYSDSIMKEYSNMFEEKRIIEYSSIEDENGEKIKDLPDEIIKNIDTATLFYDVLPKSITVTSIGIHPTIDEFEECVMDQEGFSTINEFLDRNDAWMYCYRYLVRHDEFIEIANNHSAGTFSYYDRMIYYLSIYILSLDETYEKFTDEERDNIINANKTFVEKYNEEDGVLLYDFIEAVKQQKSSKWTKYLGE